ncbi:hypothetical protein GCM10027093_27150 [Paraburkholderia jirisanensis]
MNLSPLGGLFTNEITRLNTKQSSGDDFGAGFNIAVNTPPAQATPATPSALPGESSTTAHHVDFDQNADAIARLAGEGVTATTLYYNPLASHIPGSRVPEGPLPLIPLDGSVSKADFQRIIAQYGGSDTQASQLFDTFDANGDGSISHSEFLAGVAQVNLDGGNTAFAQTLGALVDNHGNHDGSLSESELVDFETAFVHAETPNQTSIG